MDNDPSPSSNGSGLRAWFERLGQALSGEPRDREDLVELLRDAQSRNLFDADAAWRLASSGRVGYKALVNEYTISEITCQPSGTTGRGEGGARSWAREPDGNT